MIIRVDDLRGPRIAAFLEEHVSEMKSVSPPESKHALDLDSLQSEDVTFWSVYDGEELIACGAIKELGPEHGEIKSMRTSAPARGRGVASFLLRHLLKEASERGYSRLSLETGSMPFFEPARSLYRKFGFMECPPFSDYQEDPNSVFMTRKLSLGNDGS